MIAIKRIAEPVFAKSTLRGLGNTDAGDTVEDLANFGLCDYNAYTCGIDAAAKQPSQRSSSFLSLLGIGTANAFVAMPPSPIGGFGGAAAVALWVNKQLIHRISIKTQGDLLSSLKMTMQ
ncbi:hypothetical protein J4727_06880 [Providencia rettgeri]|uniref:Uncharacterized protein n=1 Tax=Providencia rettgeri TaxID=587 RepID=A0A939NEB9_PRORE|nr:hypothetical protein [Providencia rettgeri]